MTGNPTIKHTQITRAGYEYQDLVGIEVLIRHYRDPDLFEWVELESSDPDIKALDDVVAKRKDGSVEYVQVKFTVDGDENLLDWDWLLQKTKTGTSMLAKWATSFIKAKANGPIHSAYLATNRNPSASFARCLHKKRVELSKVDAALRASIENECGGAAAAEIFFKDFTFEAGMPDLVGYETAVKGQIVYTDTDNAGWLVLRDSVRQWAILKNAPPPDGRILRDHVVSLISKRRPKPLRQDFFIPENYHPPSNAFDDAVIARINDEKTPITILWGTPGRGKSTYLSYLAGKLHDESHAVIRHHYFLSSEDKSTNRMSFVDIAASLYDQLYSRYPNASAGVADDPELLSLGLETAASNLARGGKRLFLIVDGLDHVYRDTQRVDMLNQLFSSILPLPANVSLIVGTQRVADAQLPSRLLLAAQDEDWIEIPRMDEVAVHRWVREQDRARPFLLTWSDPSRRNEEIDSIGTKLFKISNGHPLHLIFALESLIRSGSPISSNDVDAIPACPDGDIRTYYKRLWLKLSPDAKDTLHVLAGSDFFWPGIGIRECIGDFSEISFLLEPHHSGMMPFHGSVFAWVKERSDHAESYRLLLPKVIVWLRDKAPPYWRWGWLWLTQATNNDPAPLLAGATRAWSLESMANGWPERQIRNILGAAEKISFENGNLPETARIRSLKTRVSNAREFQMRDFGTFRGTALAVSGNTQQALNLLDDIGDLSDSELTSLAIHGPEEVRAELLEGCFAEVARRINTWVELQHRRRDDFRTLLDQLLMIAAASPTERVQRVLRYLKGFKDPAPHLDRFVQILGENFNLDGLIEVQKALRSKKWTKQRRILNEFVLRSALFRGAAPDPLLTAPLEETSAFVAVWRRRRKPSDEGLFYVPPLPQDLARERMSPNDTLDLKQFYYEQFWLTLSIAMKAAGPFSMVRPARGINGQSVLDVALDCLEVLAKDVATGALPFGFSSPYLAAADVPVIFFQGRNDTELSIYRSFRDALGLIALDLHLMGLTDPTKPQVAADEFAVARSSVHWVDELWISSNIRNRVPLFDKAGVVTMLDELRDVLEEKISEFNERGEQWTHYANLAHLYGVEGARELIRRAADCAIGYGYRKDLGAIDILDAIENVHTRDSSRTREWLDKLIPIIDEITEFTDGDETNHVRSRLIQTVAKTDLERLPLFYTRHLAVDDWQYADECLQEFMKVVDLITPEAAALAGTLLDLTTIGVLEDRAEVDPAAAVLLQQQLQFLGTRPIERKREYSSTDRELTEAERRAVTRSPTVFGPSSFAKVAAAVGKRDFHYSHRKDFLVRWLKHWESKGKARTALKSVASFFDSEASTHDVDEMLDDAFEVSLVAEGKDAAYRWIVRAHVQRHGWQSFYTTESEVVQRLEKVAAVYPERWMNFIKDSSVPMRYWSSRGYGFSLGYRYLVRFLILVGQIKLASDVTAAFVETFVHETQDQPIPEARWLQ